MFSYMQFVNARDGKCQMIGSTHFLTLFNEPMDGRHKLFADEDHLEMHFKTWFSTKEPKILGVFVQSIGCLQQCHQCMWENQHVATGFDTTVGPFGLGWCSFWASSNFHVQICDKHAPGLTVDFVGSLETGGTVFVSGFLMIYPCQVGLKCRSFFVSHPHLKRRGSKFDE